MPTNVLLSDKYAASAEPQQRHWDKNLAGFFLECGKTTRTWYVEHKGARTNLGRYPAISATSARDAAKKVMAGTVKREAVAPTLREATADYVAHGGRRGGLRSAHNKQLVSRQMELHMKKFLNRRLDTIEKLELRAQHEALKVQHMGKDNLGRATPIGGERTANHVMQTFRTIWNHAADKMMDEALKPCPTSSLRMIDPEKEEVKIIDDLERWEDEVARLDVTSRLTYRLLLTTGMRKTECLSLTWDQVLDDRIHLPETKNGKAFDVPLEPEHHVILDVARELQRKDLPWVFPSSKGDGHMKVPQKISWTAQLHRATFATIGVNAGLSSWEVGQLLNHTIPGVTARKYVAKNVEQYRPFMRRVLDALAV